MSEATPKYEILFSRARAHRGLKPWGVFEVVDSTFSRGISQHDTRAEAVAALPAPAAKAVCQ